jgi:hypothetical protein
LQKSEPLGLFDQAVEVPSHICLFYYDDAELRERLAFLEPGLEAPDEAVVLFGPEPRLRQILGYLADASERDIDRDLADGKIVLVEGAPTADEILSNIGAALDALVARHVRLIRFLGFIGWQDPEWPPTDDLLAFEANVNRAVANYPVITVCTYRLTDLPGPTLIFGGIQTHPLTIIGETLCENPHYLAGPAAAVGGRPHGLHADAASLENVRLLRESGDEPGR